MELSCHNALNKLSGSTDVTVALAGNPNVGKSSIFNSLTGMGVDTANYPGKTVEVNMAVSQLNGTRIGIFDLPGTYALGHVSEDQWVARQGVLDGNPDAVVMVIDATNLARNLYMVLQFLELGYPMVAALNVLDVARRQGRDIDIDKLSKRLGIRILPTVANRGEGLEELMEAAVEAARAGTPPDTSGLAYGRDVESDIAQLTEAIAAGELEDPYGLPHRALALLLLENDPEFIELTSQMPGWQPVLDLAAGLRRHIEIEHGQAASTRIAAERHALAGMISDEVETLEHGHPRKSIGERLWRATTNPVTGVPILVGMLALVFVTMYFVGQTLADLLSNAWGTYAGQPLAQLLYDTFGQNVATNSLQWAIGGIQAALTVGIPYVLVFYFVLAFLEDTGYLNSVAFLTDSVMHRLGLHGRAIIPIIAGAGCNVPAIMGTRVLTTTRERIIAGTLIVMTPCSARSAVIFGAVGFYAGWEAALGIYVIVGALWVLLGLALNRMMPGSSTGLVMEMFPFRRPHLKTVFRKTWFRFKAFLLMAVPILLAGSLVLGVLFESGHLYDIANVFSPVVQGWMGLPTVAGLVLIMAILRKELALQLLAAMAIATGATAGSEHNLLLIMNREQLFVFALVTAIYIPCAATITALSRELGWKRSGIIMAFTIVLAVLVGGLVNQAFRLFS